MAKFITIPIGDFDWTIKDPNKRCSIVVNVDLIVGFCRHEWKEGTSFWTVDGKGYYCPWPLDKFKDIISKYEFEV